MVVPRLNIPLVLEEKERQPDTMGGYRVVWRSRGLVHALMQRGVGRLRGAEAGPESVTDWKITVRAFPLSDPRRPLPGQRFRMGARLIRIEAVAEVGAMGRHLIVTGQEE